MSAAAETKGKSANCAYKRRTFWRQLLNYSASRGWIVHRPLSPTLENEKNQLIIYRLERSRRIRDRSGGTNGCGERQSCSVPSALARILGARDKEMGESNQKSEPKTMRRK